MDHRTEFLGAGGARGTLRVSATDKEFVWAMLIIACVTVPALGGATHRLDLGLLGGVFVVMAGAMYFTGRIATLLQEILDVFYDRERSEPQADLMAWVRYGKELIEEKLRERQPRE